MCPIFDTYHLSCLTIHQKILWGGSFGCKLLNLTCLTMKSLNCHHTNKHSPWKLIRNTLKTQALFSSIHLTVKCTEEALLLKSLTNRSPQQYFLSPEFKIPGTGAINSLPNLLYILYIKKWSISSHFSIQFLFQVSYNQRIYVPVQ